MAITCDGYGTPRHHHGFPAQAQKTSHGTTAYITRPVRESIIRCFRAPTSCPCAFLTSMPSRDSVDTSTPGRVESRSGWLPGVDGWLWGLWPTAVPWFVCACGCAQALAVRVRLSTTSGPRRTLRFFIHRLSPEGVAHAPGGRPGRPRDLLTTTG